MVVESKIDGEPFLITNALCRALENGQSGNEDSAADEWGNAMPATTPALSPRPRTEVRSVLQVIGATKAD